VTGDCISSITYPSFRELKGPEYLGTLRRQTSVPELKRLPNRVLSEGMEQGNGNLYAKISSGYGYLWSVHPLVARFFNSVTKSLGCCCEQLVFGLFSSPSGCFGRLGGVGWWLPGFFSASN
jgi:hypothetical protein